MGLKILLVYLLGILLCQPVYIWGIRTLCRMEDEDEELYCQDNGMYYEPRGHILMTGWGEIPALFCE